MTMNARELVLRLASLLWRLCRATIMEPGLFEMQATNFESSGSLESTRTVPTAIEQRTAYN